ncbi:MAG: AAA family ATPase [Clostridia bacterium]|nr:AAA family ATPase [Clostridia bacterium]
MKDFEIEKLQLEKVEEFISNTINSLQEKNKESEDKIMKLKEYLNHMMKIAPDEIIKIYEQVSENFSLVEQRLRKIKKFEQVKKSPYFGKIVIKEYEDIEDLYIGLFDISDMESGRQYVLDWRAPICSLYYHSMLGKTTYKANEEIFDIELLKKRQLTIKNGELEYYCDTDNKINDEVLQEILSHNTSAYMANIIRTIQAEQDEIIRQPLFKTIIVDGVAGSGKTSIGMHRIAYLLYENRNTLTNENILILSPNELFSQYVSQLLPELGEDNVKTIPFSLFLSEKFPNLRNAESKSEMMENILFEKPERHINVEQKHTEEYANKLMDFLGEFNLEKCIGTIKIRNKKIIVPNLKKNYNLTYQNRYKIFKRIEFITDEIIDQVFYGNSLNESDGDLRKEIKEIILKKIYKFKLFNTFISLNGLSDTLIKNNIAYDDIATYAFIEMSINGFPVDNNIKQLFIDEVQDYSPISIKMIKEIFPSATLTIVGDYNQNLITTNKNLNYLKEQFPISSSFKLNNSYRSSNNIMRLANSVINANLQTTLTREGDLPKAIEYQNELDLQNIINTQMQNFDKHQKTAIICKTKHEAEQLSNLLPDFTPAIDEKITNPFFENNKIITTVFLSKGLEFDNVFVYNVTNENFNTDTDKQILYVMITRALHNVTLLYQNQLCSLVDSTKLSFIK